MKKNYLWFDEQLWSSLTAGTKKHGHAQGSEHQAVQGGPRPKHGYGLKSDHGRGWIG